MCRDTQHPATVDPYKWYFRTQESVIIKPPPDVDLFPPGTTTESAKQEARTLLW